MLCICQATLLAQTTDFYLPHTTQTPGEWDTSLVLYNPTGTRADLALTAYTNDGTEVGRLERSLPPRGRLDETIATLMPGLADTRGWLHIQSSTDELSGVMTFSALQLGGRASLPLVTTVADGLAFANLEHHDLRQSGLVLTNPGDEETNVTLFIRSENSTSTQTITLAAHAKWVGMLVDLVPEDTPAAASVDVVGTKPITGFALTFQNNVQQIFAVPATAASTSALAAWHNTVAGAYTVAQIKVGVSAAYHRGDNTPIVASSGFAGRDPLVFAEPDMRSEIGSITKSFTAAVLLQLQEEGRVDLDQPIAAYLPNLPRADVITTRMLLNHTSGLKNYTAEPEFNENINEQFNGGPSWPVNEIIDFAFDKGFDFDPGTGWQYSNSGYLLAGMVAEQVSGVSLLELYRTRLFEPLGMRDTYYGGYEAIDTRAKVYSFSTVNGLYTDVTHISLEWAGAAGAIISTTQDLLTWSKSLFGGRVLSEAALQEMLTVTPLATPEVPYALGIIVADLNGEPIYTHDGATLGGVSSFIHFPERQSTFAILVNCSFMDPAYNSAVASWLQTIGLQPGKRGEIPSILPLEATVPALPR